MANTKFVSELSHLYKKRRIHVAGFLNLTEFTVPLLHFGDQNVLTTGKYTFYVLKKKRLSNLLLKLNTYRVTKTFWDML